MGNAGNGTSGIDTSFTADDGRLRPEWYDDDGWRWITNDDAWSLKGWINEWWPGAVGMDASGGEWCQAIWFDTIEFNSGCVGRFGFLGVTRDVYGTAVGGVTVKLYHTADDSVVCVTTSDSLGNFGVTTQYYPDAHYMVAYKAGPPDIEGTTANTLIPG